MKRIITPLILFLLVASASAQSSIDRLFDEYQGRDGFVTVSVSGSFLKMIGEFDDDDEFLKHSDKFTAIRILAQEDDDIQSGNFYELIIDELDKGGYEEMVRINSADADVKIMVKAEGKVFTEFLLVAGGDDNALIQIKGRMTDKMVKEMSDSVNDDHAVFGLR
ncbi:MAG: DUF4252 domain-containing protein [Bacteroidales bacterium]